MAEVPGVLPAPNSVLVRRPATTDQTLAERSRETERERLNDTARIEARDARDIERFDDRRARLDQLRADEFREILRQRELGTEVLDRQIDNRRRFSDVQDRVEQRRRIDRQVADSELVRDIQSTQLGTDQAIIDRERRLVGDRAQADARSLERDLLADRRPRVDASQAAAEGRALDATAFRRILDAEALDERQQAAAAQARANLLASERAAFAEAVSGDAVTVGEPRAPQVEILPPLPREAPAPVPVGVFVEAEPVPFETPIERPAPLDGPPAPVPVEDPGEANQELALEEDRNQRIDDRRFADRDFRIQQEIALQQTLDRITTVGFDSALPRGSIVDVIG